MAFTINKGFTNEQKVPAATNFEQHGGYFYFYNDEGEAVFASSTGFTSTITRVDA